MKILTIVVAIAAMGTSIFYACKKDVSEITGDSKGHGMLTQLSSKKIFFTKISLIFLPFEIATC